MENKNLNAINNIYKNAEIALQSINNILPEAVDGEIKNELKKEYEGYEKLISEITTYASQNKIDISNVNPFKKAMLYSSIKMNTLTDDSTSHIADLMLKGTVMGISELLQIISRGKGVINEEIINLAVKLKNLEESYESNLKALL